MSARNAIIDEIEAAPESLVREAHDFILFLKQRGSREREHGKPQATAAKPDFLARQQALFGSRVLTNPQAVLDELRANASTARRNRMPRESPKRSEFKT